jgi:hypothetical protein
VRLLARLEHDDIAGVADYLSRIASRSSGGAERDEFPPAELDVKPPNPSDANPR